MAQRSVGKAKNHRYRGAKISEYRLRRVVQCFARDMSARDAAAATKLSRPSVEAIYRRLRVRLSEQPIVTFVPGPERSPAMRTVVNRKTAGVSDADFPLHEMAMLTRILNTQHFAGFEELSAANPEHVARAVRLRKTRLPGGARRYNVFERLKPVPGEIEPQTRPFDPLAFEADSAILINEIKADPHEAHFRYIWRLLLSHPL